MTVPDPGSGPSPPSAISRTQLFTIVVALEGSLLALALGLGWLTGHHPLASVRFAAVPVGIGVGGGILLGFFALPGLEARWPPLQRITAVVREMTATMFGNATVLDVALVSLLAGLGEEALFRGWLQPFLADLVGLPAAVLMAGLLFGLAHPVSPLYIILAAMIGVGLGTLTALGHDLSAAIAAHAIYDFVVLTALRRELDRSA